MTPRERITQILTDYDDGLLDSREDAADALMDIFGGEDALRLIAVPDLGTQDRRLDDAETPHPRS